MFQRAYFKNKLRSNFRFSRFNRTNNKKISNGFFHFFRNLSTPKRIFLTYFLITIITSLLLWGKFSHNQGANVSYIDALFTSASAFSDTGLTVSPTALTYNIFGQTIIAIVILLGGFGFFALKAYFINLFVTNLQGKNYSMKLVERNVLSAERGSSVVGETRKIVLSSIWILAIIMIIGAIVLSFYFYFVPGNFIGNTNADPLGDISLSIRYGFFHSISAINNAGFDIIGANSIAPYFKNYTIQIIFLILFIIGGMGYPVIFDVYTKLKYKIVPKHRLNKERHRFSLFTKISVTTYLIVAFIGLLLVFIFEIFSSSPETIWGIQEINGQPISQGDKIMAIIFNTMSTRNAGFSSFDLNKLTTNSILVFSIMMFIGSAPASTAGGIRTITLAVIILSIIARATGRSSVRVFKRRLPFETSSGASTVLAVSTILCTIGIFGVLTSFSTGLSNTTNGPRNVINAIFEVTSAFGTTGLSLGITSSLNIFSKILLIFIMFIGQLGISSTILVAGNKKSKSYAYEYISEDVTIG
ncbi:TrkH family potassium uptake protein [[Mycoplasma] mobile]|uniref:Potassium uptake protein B n=1 Tax=Mycoplasma mobile (strain ATCC 43663 / 163K / NCTC 11711) TaxID=267748 RepID=Q6KHL8_MYCM1|nr:potassium transporter TrkG [[Mycoplasma] mobile]AAT27912.1 potassium uptake protein B [Mycoplasma mobile 163K]